MFEPSVFDEQLGDELFVESTIGVGPLCLGCLPRYFPNSEGSVDTSMRRPNRRASNEYAPGPMHA